MCQRERETGRDGGKEREGTSLIIGKKPTTSCLCGVAFEWEQRPLCRVVGENAPHKPLPHPGPPGPPWPGRATLSRYCWSDLLGGAGGEGTFRKLEFFLTKLTPVLSEAGLLTSAPNLFPAFSLLLSNSNKKAPPSSRGGVTAILCVVCVVCLLIK